MYLGNYYSLYDFKVVEKTFPIAHICQSELTTTRYSFKKGAGLNKMNKYLLDESPQKRIVMTS